jgi:uncharacterized protein
MSKWRWLARAIVACLLIGSVMLAIIGIILCEGSLHIDPRMRRVANESQARRLAKGFQSVEISSPDGIPLRAWYLKAERSNGASVLLLHGVAAHRGQMLGYVPMFLKSGYNVLIPDHRGHGDSGGDVITYGIRESADVPRWADWLIDEAHASRIYGLGLSLGGAVLIQSLEREQRFRALAAEGAYSSFWEVARDRVLSGMPTPLASIVFWPIARGAFTYAGLRYGFDLDDAAPARALKQSSTPVLLIHGDLDFETPLEHSRRLAEANPKKTELWVVPSARHVGALGTAREEFERRVLRWFDQHR